MLNSDLSALLTTMRRMHVAVLDDNWQLLDSLEVDRCEQIAVVVKTHQTLSRADRAALTEIIELDELIALQISQQMLEVANHTRAAA